MQDAPAGSHRDDCTDPLRDIPVKAAVGAQRVVCKAAATVFRRLIVHQKILPGPDTLAVSWIIPYDLDFALHSSPLFSVYDVFDECVHALRA